MALIFLSACKSTKNNQLVNASYIQEIDDHRMAYKNEFLQDERSPLQSEKALKGLRFYSPDPFYVVNCKCTLTPKAKPFEMATYSGETKPYRSYATAICTLKEDTFNLTLYQNLRYIRMPGYKDHLFIPFKDETNGNATYGGGRYMDAKIGDIIDGKITLDFNKSYNPWCAFSDGYSCPVPPIENHLSFEVVAGEKNYFKSDL